MAQRVINCNAAAWGGLFSKAGMSLPKASLIVFEGTITTPCGKVDWHAVYCPANMMIYLRASSMQKWSNYYRLLFSEVVFHEYAHHVQGSMGIWEGYDRDEDRMLISRRIELQAACLSARMQFISRGMEYSRSDYDEVADVRRYVGESVHGTAKSQVYWTVRGLYMARLSGCNTWVVPPSMVA